MEKKEFTIGKNSIHAVFYTPDNKKRKETLVLIHGSWGALWMWDMYVEFLVEKGWGVLALDLRGHGKSGGSVEGATMQDYVNDVEVVTKELALDNVIVIGHSMGGLIALMYAAQNSVKSVVSIDGSPSIEVIGLGEDIKYPISYTIMDVGMPSDMKEIMKALPDVKREQIMAMKSMFGKESGVARSERKKGISIPKESISSALFVGAEMGESVPFGIGSATARKMAEFYDSPFIEVKGATHPGILMGVHALESASLINERLRE